MALLNSPDIYGYTIFCDDIRQEADGKSIFIGVYGADMIVHAPFPFTLPKFGFGITLVQQKMVFNPNISLQIFLPGDVPENASIQAVLSEQKEGAVGADLDAKAENRHPATRGVEDEHLIYLSANMTFTSLIIKEPGQIRVRASRGDDVIRLGTLRISPPPANTALV